MNPSPDYDHHDDHVDQTVKACLDLENGASFFVFAGAGSGKTSSLVEALKHIREEWGERLAREGRKIGVISYTNAACDEIKQRRKHDALLSVSTIHSFAWSLIKGFDDDIRDALKDDLGEKIAKLEAGQASAKNKTTKTYQGNERRIEVSRMRLANIKNVPGFTYDPNGDNTDKNSLSHAEVIDFASAFLLQKPLLQRILVNRFPVLLVDESQDTHKKIVQALFAVEETHRGKFILGLFGDQMQQIYLNGVPNLGGIAPPSWKTPSKEMNHRSGSRIIELANKVREDTDRQAQKARQDRAEGTVRLFIAPNSVEDRLQFEQSVAETMADLTGDEHWKDLSTCKVLILEHHMAAARMGFLDMFRALDASDRLKTGLRDGKLAGLRLFKTQVLPLLQARLARDEFGEMAVLKKHSPLMKKDVFRAKSDQKPHLMTVKTAADQLLALWDKTSNPRFGDVLEAIERTKLFDIPESLKPYVEKETWEDATEGDDEDKVSLAWRLFLGTSFAQIGPYSSYVAGEAHFDTHQGVKGLEFDRVMVIMDDKEARGFQFSYEKLFGVKAKTPADLKKEAEGGETGIDSTRRLFYVTCTRAKDSLALVAYSEAPDRLVDFVKEKGWFLEKEVIKPSAF